MTTAEKSSDVTEDCAGQCNEQGADDTGESCADAGGTISVDDIDDEEECDDISIDDNDTRAMVGSTYDDETDTLSVSSHNAGRKMLSVC